MVNPEDQKKEDMLYTLQVKAETALREMEKIKGSTISKINLYHGDIIVDGVECSGTKLMIDFE
jgi:hypothetical protein